jgi:hypothetical protein
MYQHDIDANVYGLATKFPNVPPPRPAPKPFPTGPHQSGISKSVTGIEDCFEVASAVVSMDYSTLTAANTRTRERVPDPIAVERSQGAFNVCYLCDSLFMSSMSTEKWGEICV